MFRSRLGLSNEPYERRSKLNEGQEVSRELLKAHRDSPETLDALEEDLDEMSVLVEVLVDLAYRGSRRIRGNDDRATLRLQLLDERAGVVRAVACDVRVDDAAEQRRRDLYLVRLAG